MDKWEIFKHILSGMNQRGDTWFTGAIIMAGIVLASLIRLILR